jgi:hypothetical protein
MNVLVNIAIAFIALFMNLYILMNYFFYDETRTAAGVFAIWFTRKLLNLIPKDSILVISEMLEELIKKDAAKGNILSLFKQNFVEFGQKVKNTGEWIKKSGIMEKSRRGNKSCKAN